MLVIIVLVVFIPFELVFEVELGVCVDVVDVKSSTCAVANVGMLVCIVLRRVMSSQLSSLSDFGSWWSVAPNTKGHPTWVAFMLDVYRLLFKIVSININEIY